VYMCHVCRVCANTGDDADGEIGRLQLQLVS
jgi:hypothetical protein